MKAIETRFTGPTDRRGARIIASDCDGNRTSIGYPYALSGEEVHRAAAIALCKKMDWSGSESLIAGSTKRGYVFVFTK